MVGCPEVGLTHSTLGVRVRLLEEVAFGLSHRGCCQVEKGRELLAE